MRKLILGLIVAGIVLVAFFSIRPLLGVFTSERSSVEDRDDIEAQIDLDPAREFTVRQGDSYRVLMITNNSSEAVNFSLGHEHNFLTFSPRGGTLNPGSARQIEIDVDHRCPTGYVDLPVYVRVETGGRRLGLETFLVFEVTPGSLALDYEEGELVVLWNDGPAPGGVMVTYREPGEDDWRVWGETPRLNPPDHLETGSYDFEFQAKLGEVESPVRLFSIDVDRPVVAEPDEEEERPAATTAARPAAAPQPQAPEPEEEPEPLTRSQEMLIRSWEESMRQERQATAAEKADEDAEWWEIEIDKPSWWGN